MDEKPVKRVNRLEQGTGKFRKGEEKLMNDASVFFGTLNDLSTLIAIMEPNGNIIFTNNTGMDFADLKPKDVVGKKFYDRYWWQYSEKAIQLIKNDVEMCASGKTMVREIEAQADNGELVWIEFSVHPIFDENGIVKYLVAEARDITGLKKAEESLQKSHQILKKEVKKQTAELVKSLKFHRF